MSTLARRAGVARATLYNYFPSTGHVLEALVEAEVTAFLSDLDRQLAASAPTLASTGATARAATTTLAGTGATARAATTTRTAAEHPAKIPADPAGQLRLAISALVGWVARQSAMGPAARAGRGARSPDPASIHRPLAAIQARIEQLIKAARDAGALRPGTDPALAARFAVTLAYGVRWQLGGADRDRTAADRTAADRTAADRTAASLRQFLLAGLGLPAT